MPGLGAGPLLQVPGEDSCPLRVSPSIAVFPPWQGHGPAWRVPGGAQCPSLCPFPGFPSCRRGWGLCKPPRQALEEPQQGCPLPILGPWGHTWPWPCAAISHTQPGAEPAGGGCPAWDTGDRDPRGGGTEGAEPLVSLLDAVPKGGEEEEGPRCLL